MCAITGKAPGRGQSASDLATTSAAVAVTSPPANGGANGRAVLPGLRGSMVGKSIEAAGLRGLSDAFLVALERGGRTLHAVGPSEVLQAGDVLWFAGSADGVISLRKIPGTPWQHTRLCPTCQLSHNDRHVGLMSWHTSVQYVSLLCSVQRSCTHPVTP
jgi:TrkA-C domain